MSNNQSLAVTEPEVRETEPREAGNVVRFREPAAELAFEDYLASCTGPCEGYVYGVDNRYSL